MMPRSDRRSKQGNGQILGITIAALPFVALAGCAPAPAPYYVAHPAVVVVPSVEPDTTTHYVYGDIHSTNETHITSESTVHIISNHPIGGVTPPPPPGNVAPPPVSPPAADNQVAEPAPPEEQAPQPEPADETPAEPPADETPTEPPSEPEADTPPEAPPEEAEPPSEPSSSDDDNSDK